jgi:hypothetical protein
MKLGYHIILHLLGIGCIAACLVIVGSKGDIDLYWSGWVAVAFFAMLALGILCGWFPWRGQPLRVLLKGVYVMSALALVGFGFSMDDPARPQLWMVLAPVAAAVVLRIPIRMTLNSRGDTAADGPLRHRGSHRERDPFI